VTLEKTETFCISTVVKSHTHIFYIRYNTSQCQQKTTRPGPALQGGQGSAEEVPYRPEPYSGRLEGWGGGGGGGGGALKS